MVNPADCKRNSRARIAVLPGSAAKRFVRTLGVTFILVWLPTLPLTAELRESLLARSVVGVNVYSGSSIERRSTGFVVQSDRFNGYVVANANSLVGGDTVTVTVPATGGELVAQVMRTERAIDFVLLKVNGLNVAALPFAVNPPASGDVVWSVVKSQNDNSSVGLARGILTSNYALGGSGFGLFSHSAILGDGGVGSVLVNQCGQVIGLNLSTATADGSVRAVDTSTLRNLLVSQNVKLTVAPASCLSEVAVAQREARQASEDARRAQTEAEKAQVVARKLEQRLASSTEQNAVLVAQTQEARRRADAALLAAQKAREEADRNRLILQERTENLRREAEMLKDKYEQDQAFAQSRFESLMKEQEASSRQREYILIGLVVVLIIGVLTLLILRRGGETPGAGRRNSPKPPTVVRDLPPRDPTDLAGDQEVEYVLDGRDDAGIRYLLRIAAEQLEREVGVVIGRNPGEALYIINHADVSRQHVRIKVMRQHMFVEDLDSTNGTKVNGQSIDGKGLVAVEDGDQIVIGSVAMDLRVLRG